MPHKLFSLYLENALSACPDFICFFLNEISIAFINLYSPMTSIERLKMPGMTEYLDLLLRLIAVQ